MTKFPSKHQYRIFKREHNTCFGKRCPTCNQYFAFGAIEDGHRRYYVMHCRCTTIKRDHDDAGM